MWAFILICFEHSHNGRTLLGHLVYLSSCFRDEKSEAKKGSHSKLSGWWVAGAPEVPPPVPFPADSAAHTSGPTLCSAGFSSTGLSPDRELWERRSGLDRCQHPPRIGALPASS